MKIYISVDMEGIPGTFNWEHEKIDRQVVRNLIYRHLEQIISALKESRQNNQITDIIIADSHSQGDNVSYGITELDERISLISGSPRPFYMMPALPEDTDRVFLIGYHAGTGALMGNMDHTYSNSRIHNIWLNGKRMNEALINAAYAGYKGIPVTLVSGDMALKKELFNEEGLPWVDFVVTKEAIAKYSAKNYSISSINQKVIHAINHNLQASKTEYPLYVIQSPIELKIEFQSTAMADVACLMPETQRLDGRNVIYKNDDYQVIFEAIMALVTLAYSASL